MIRQITIRLNLTNALIYLFISINYLNRLSKFTSNIYQTIYLTIANRHRFTFPPLILFVILTFLSTSSSSSTVNSSFPSPSHPFLLHLILSYLHLSYNIFHSSFSTYLFPLNLAGCVCLIGARNYRVGGPSL